MPISFRLITSISLSTFLHALNSTIFVGVHIKNIDSNNVTASIYDGWLYNEKIENADTDVQNKSHLFIFDVKYVPVSSKEEKENEDEDEDAEFRICALLDNCASR